MKFVALLSLFVVSGFTEKTEKEWISVVENIGFFQALAIQYLSIFDPWKCPQWSPENLEKENDKAIECVKNIRNNSSFCDTFVHHFKPCVQGLLEEVKKCEAPDEIAFKNMILDSSVEEARFICGVDGEHILEIWNPCVIDSVQLSNGCRKNITRPLGHTIYPTAICSLQKCFENQLQQECRNELTRTTLHDLFSVNVEPCNAVMMVYFELAEYLR
ncbi:uncharacterized protein LOC123313810 isoform X2 [Coccinella septempunctata]|uniref:uncharacterized protein LOC123313810 isoform X2 n=1 Tax=Coccinella septempunctata TaxID=41139 RepID=UPI001D06A4BE|nr:uncharacterized protein LOC123313810 isoform X2 [Coccinella septempunctata]